MKNIVSMIFVLAMILCFAAPVMAEAKASEENVEAADIFKTARYNNFNVGKVIIDAIIAGEL